MVDVSSGSAIKQDELKDLLKLVVPDIRKTADKLRDAVQKCARMSASSPRAMLAANENPSGCQAAGKRGRFRAVSRKLVRIGV